MLVQAAYAVLTMVPCPLWFWYRWLSAAFLLVVFVWSIYNGATFYIDVFGKRFQNELEQLKRDVTKVQVSAEAGEAHPPGTPKVDDARARLDERDPPASLETEAMKPPTGESNEAAGLERKQQ